MMHKELTLSGSGGQGLILGGIILAEAGLFDDKNVVQSQSYGPEARGGASRSDVIISDNTINYPKVDESDILLALTQESCDKYIDSLKSGGMLILDDGIENLPERDDIKIYTMGIVETATNKLARPMVANIVALGSICELTEVTTKESLEKAVLNRVPKGTEDLNKKALEEGFALAKTYKDNSCGETC